MTTRSPSTTARFSTYLLLMLLVMAALAATFGFYVQAEKQIDQANETRFLATHLSRELRQSSDDLTRLARIFVVTGDPAYQAQYQEILDIRDGRKPRPPFAGSKGQREQKSRDYRLLGAGVAVPILDLMQQTGLADDEMAKLVAAKSNSDALARRELHSMATIASNASADPGLRDRAIEALHDATYNQLKSGILQPIGDVENMVNARTMDAVRRSEDRAMGLRLVLILLGLSQLFLMWKTYQQLHAILGCSVQELHRIISRFGAGDFSKKPDLPERGKDSVLGWLIDANNKLARLELHQYEVIVNSTDDAIVSETLSGTITSWNPAAEKIFGYAASEIIGKSTEVIVPSERIREKSEFLARISRGERIDHFETMRVCKDGRLITISATISPIQDEDGNIIGASTISRDITERKIAEQDLTRMTRALKTLSACNAALVHATNEAELLASLCRMIVETGGYRMSWVGRADTDANKTVTPVAWFGAGADYLSNAKITWADDERGQGPTGTAIRREIVQVNQNFLTNPAVAVWRDRAIAHGFSASIALPIRMRSANPLVLTIYAAESDAFDTPEVRLLEELADNLAFGLDGMRNRAEKHALADQNRKLSLTVEQSPESVVITDLDGKIEYVNEAFLSNTGYAREEVIGQNPRILKSGKTAQETYLSLWQSLLAGKVWKGELYNQRKDGSHYTEFATISPIRDSSGTLTHYVALKEDITAKKESEERILHLAYYDSLTNLPNRRLLIDRLQVSLASAIKAGHFGALFYVDLDNFKNINDTLGHDLGDQLLRQVAARLCEYVAPGDTVASFAADDFILLTPELGADARQAEKQARALGERILSCFHAPFSIGHIQCRTTPSIGVTLFGHPQDTLEETLKQVDLAMYEAKSAGRNTMRFFDARVQAAVIAETKLEADLRTALEQGEFRLYYQIQVDDSERPVGAEALVRWAHPQQGLITPDAFISTAEKTGLIVPIGEWVLETACARLAAWASEPELAHLTLGVNVSAKQFSQPDFVRQCLATLARTGANPNRLKLEPTESVLLENVEDTIAKMIALRMHGVRFALDDFGTGYSSLTYLRRLPLDQLKIDQSFARDIPNEPNACVIARTIVVLGQSLGLAVIAEGVENREQRRFLEDNGCRLYQGYLYGRPMPPDDFEASIKRKPVA